MHGAQGTCMQGEDESRLAGCESQLEYIDIRIFEQALLQPGEA